MEKNQKSVYLELLIAAVVLAAGAFLTKYIYITAVFLPFPTIYIFGKRGVGFGLVSFLLTVLFSFLFLPQYFLIISGMVLLVVVSSGIALRKKMPSYDSLVLSCIGCFLALAALIGFIYLTTGQDPITVIMEKIERDIQKNDFLAYFIYMNDVSSHVMAGTMDLTQAALATMEEMRAYVLTEEVLTNMKATLSYYIPMLGMWGLILTGMFSYLVPRAILKQTGERVANVPPFSLFKLPRKVSIYFVLMYVLALVPSWFEIESLEMAGVILSSILSFVFMIQGLSLIDWLFKKKIRQRGLRVFLLIIVTLVFSGILVYIGLFEQIFRIREAKFKKVS